jgi:hypothetical protein
VELSSRKIVANQWHPEQGSIDFPQLHIGTGAGASLGSVHKYHLATGRVSLENVPRLAIREFQVESVRADWEEVLGETQAAYEAWRTWPGLCSNLRA